MAERLKDRYFTDESIETFAALVKRHHPPFDDRAFVARLTGPDFQGLELMAMARRATEHLAELLPDDYRKALAILTRVRPEAAGMEAFCLPTYVELFGLDDWDASLPAMADFTKKASSEFAIRPYLLADAERAMAFLDGLTDDEDPAVRRFASEGCRPRLPWGVSLPEFKADPTLVLHLLERLKDDEAEFVQKSVANNLNDISKDHPEVVLETCARWQGSSPAADWIVKRACRTLLKKRDSRAMRLFGFGDPEDLHVLDPSVEPATVAIGDDARLSFTFRVGTKAACKVRLEYVVDYVKAGGKTSPKVFQIREATLDPGDHDVSRKLSFVDRSTRKHYPGEHRIAVVVNGVEKAETTLSLTEAP